MPVRVYPDRTERDEPGLMCAKIVDVTWPEKNGEWYQYGDGIRLLPAPLAIVTYEDGSHEAMRYVEFRKRILEDRVYFPNDHTRQQVAEMVERYPE